MENNRRVISVGDVHCKGVWKQIDPAKYDTIVFAGDYVDSWDESNDQMISNLLDIVEFKKGYPDKVILGIGNHELSYWPGLHQVCSGYRAEIAGEITAIYQDNRKLFQAAFQMNDHLWTHAGVHVGWWNKFIREFEKELERRGLDGLDKPETMAEQLNMAFELNLPCLFDVSHLRGGREDVGGIFWCDKRELEKKPFPGIRQVVGHTPVPEITTIKNVTFIDCLEFGKQEFLELVL